MCEPEGVLLGAVWSEEQLCQIVEAQRLLIILLGFKMHAHRPKLFFFCIYEHVPDHFSELIVPFRSHALLKINKYPIDQYNPES